MTNTSSESCSNRRLLTVNEVSESFGVSIKTVRRLIDRGLLKRSLAIRHIRIPKESVDAFIAATTK